MKLRKKSTLLIILALAVAAVVMLAVFRLAIAGSFGGLRPELAGAAQTEGVVHVTSADLRQLETRLTIIFAGVLAGGVVLTFFLLHQLLIRRMIARLARLGAELKEVQRSGNLSARMSAQGDDEIAHLVEEINHLLISVESSQRMMERVNAEMQQRVAERTTALADANAALEADIAERIKAEQEREGLREQLIRSSKMEAVGTLAGGIAHDFNNILAGMLGHAQIVAEDLPADHPAQTYLRHVVTAGERAASLVRQILAFSRQTHGERKQVSVGQIAREALSLLRAALPSGIMIRCDVEATADLVNADPTQLHQVFMNLGANAGHAIGSRGGELSIKIASLHFGDAPANATSPQTKGDYVSIEVRDTGCGMSREVMTRIFDPFFSTKPINEGTGLGLAVVHGIVEDHGGTIQVESEPGKGTVFRILLPSATNPEPTSVSRHAMPLRGSERILVVDDEDMVLSVLSNSLQRLGYRVLTEQSSPAALRRLKETPNSFDLVITDQTMPHMSGLELSEAVRALRPDLPFVLVTGFSPVLSGRSAQSLGVAGIISKPVDFAELTAIMRTALASRR